MSRPFATILDSATSLSNHTGSWRTSCPKYIDRIPPCNVTCPAGENIQSWLSFAQTGEFKKAWNVMMQDNPFPATMGRVCYHKCENACNRVHVDGAVNINLIERAIGDMAIAQNWSIEKLTVDTGKKVLVIGAGPSGLAAAYFLKLNGHDVHVYESHKKCGGMMRYGVPAYRLPRNVLDAEIQRIIDIGVNIKCEHRVTNLSSELSKFDAVYVSTGAHVASTAQMNISPDAKVFDAIDVFKKFEDGEFDTSALGDNVIVYGGGNTAIDAARSALRFGAKSVKIIYRRTIDNMPAHDVEIHEALSEGVEILCLRTINSVENDKIYVDKMNYDVDNNVLSKTGEVEILECSGLICAIGQKIDMSIFADVKEASVDEDGCLDVDSNLSTGFAGLFAGGDLIRGQRTVTHAIGLGKKAAKKIDAYLNNVEIVAQEKHEIATFKKLNTAYYESNERQEVSRLCELNFEEKNITYSDENTILEARRCFSCGNCFHCDNCYGYCPDNAIIKHPDGTLEFNYDYCKGCGICSSECPCGAIKMDIDEK